MFRIGIEDLTTAFLDCRKTFFCNFAPAFDAETCNPTLLEEGIKKTIERKKNHKEHSLLAYYRQAKTLEKLKRVEDILNTIMVYPYSLKMIDSNLKATTSGVIDFDKFKKEIYLFKKFLKDN